MAPDISREPCPHRIIDDTGGAFGMGVVGGTVFHFLNGLRHGSKGRRILDAKTAVGMNAPRVGISFAAWGGLFSACDCTMVYLRQKEDPWNSIMSGALTGGLLSMRLGVPAAAGSAVAGGCLLAGFEGLGIIVNNFLSAQQPMTFDDGTPPAQGGAETGSSSSWFGGLFGGGKDQVISTAKTEVLESFDTPVPPTFDFNDMI